jgi:hypothetical protein
MAWTMDLFSAIRRAMMAVFSGRKTGKALASSILFLALGHHSTILGEVVSNSRTQILNPI